MQPTAPSEAAAVESAADDALRGADVRRELEALICLKTFDVPGHGPVEEPIYGHRDACELPAAATPVERAVDKAWVDARPILGSLSYATREPLIAAMKASAAERVAAVRRAYLSDRIVGVLMKHLGPALEAEGLRCVDCPPPLQPEPRTVDWATFAPYLAAYVWPDPVVTPRDARGKPTGESKYGMHICAGLNGIGDLPDPDPGLRELGFLAAGFTDLLIERARTLFKDLRNEKAFTRLREDEARTQWLRAQLGPRLTAEPDIRAAVCETVERFRPETGIGISDCAKGTTAVSTAP